MAEWSKAVDSKSTVGQLTGGSNPSLSVIYPGEVRERLNRRVWRARGRQKCPVGSNPTLSAHSLKSGASPRRRVLRVGSCATERCEPGQVRKEAAVNKCLWVLQGCLI